MREKASICSTIRTTVSSSHNVLQIHEREMRLEHLGEKNRRIFPEAEMDYPRTPEDVKQDTRKVFLLVLPMLQNPDSRRMDSDVSAKITYKGMAYNMDFECQTFLFERCDTQSWPGVCPANFKSYGRGVVSTQKCFENEIVLDYHGQILEKMTLTQALAMEGVQPEYLMEVRNLKFIC